MNTYRIGLRQSSGQAHIETVEADGFALDHHADPEPVYNFKDGDVVVHSFPVTAVAFVVQQP